MKLTIFRSNKGDCLLLSAKSGKSGGHALIDGGIAASFSEFVAPHLSALPKLDLVYLSHIDQDHVGGVLQLMDDEAAWRIHEYQLANGNPHHKVPAAPRPPKVDRLWHNAFHDQVGKNAGPIADMLAATAMMLSGSENRELRLVSNAHRELAQSVSEAIRLSYRAASGQLAIPLNPEFSGKLMRVVGGQPSIKIKGMQFLVIGPFDTDLARLRTEWNDWLKQNAAAVKTLRTKAAADEAQLGQNDVDRLLGPLLAQAKLLGNRSAVTAPNLASLMFLVTEGKKRVLLTGDGHCADILKGLDFHGKLNNGGIHVDVLKVQHHGSEHNTDADFARRVTADHYIFCGNGEHENPDLDVVRVYARSRFGSTSEKSGNAEVGRPFTMWFNTSSKVTEKTTNKAYVRKVEALVTSLRAQSGGQMSAKNMPPNADFMELQV